MLFIGITGGIGTGKSTLANYLRKLSYVVLDADEMAKKCLEHGQPSYTKVIAEFSSDILNDKNQIDRLKLAKIVFKDQEALSRLESIIHPCVRNLISKQKAKYEDNQRLLFYDVPLLFEKNMQENFDRIIVVSSSQENQIKRVMQRSNLSEQDILKRITMQKPLSEKIKKADYHILNDSNVVDLKEKADQIIDQLQKLNGIKS